MRIDFKVKTPFPLPRIAIVESCELPLVGGGRKGGNKTPSPSLAQLVERDSDISWYKARNGVLPAPGIQRIRGFHSLVHNDEARATFYTLTPANNYCRNLTMFLTKCPVESTVCYYVLILCNSIIPTQGCDPRYGDFLQGEKEWEKRDSEVEKPERANKRRKKEMMALLGWPLTHRTNTTKKATDWRSLCVLLQSKKSLFRVCVANRTISKLSSSLSNEWVHVLLG